MKSRILTIATALLLCVGCEEQPTASAPENSPSPDPSPGESGQDMTENTPLLPHPILEALDVRLAGIDLDTPSAVGLIWESAQAPRTLLTSTALKGHLQIALQEDSKTGHLRIVLGDSKTTAMATVEENPFVNATGGSGFFPNPISDGEGRYLLMKARESDNSEHKLVIVTTPSPSQ